MIQVEAPAADLARRAPAARCHVCKARPSDTPKTSPWTTWNDWCFAYCPAHRWRDVVFISQVHRPTMTDAGEEATLPSSGEWCIHFNRYRFDEDFGRFLAGDMTHPDRGIGDTDHGEVCLREEAAGDLLTPAGFCVSVQSALRVVMASLQRGQLHRLGFAFLTPVYLWHAGEPPIRLGG